MGNETKASVLAKKLANAKTPEEKEAILAEALKELSEAETNLDTATSFIDAQTAQLEAQRRGDKNYRPEVTITVNKKALNVLINHGVDGIAKDDLAKDLVKVAELVKNGSSAVELVTE